MDVEDVWTRLIDDVTQLPYRRYVPVSLQTQPDDADAAISQELCPNIRRP